MYQWDHHKLTNEASLTRQTWPTPVQSWLGQACNTKENKCTYQSSLQAGGKVESSAHDNKTLLLIQSLCKFFDLWVEFQCLTDQVCMGSSGEKGSEKGLVLWAYCTENIMIVFYIQDSSFLMALTATWYGLQKLGKAVKYLGKADMKQMYSSSKKQSSLSCTHNCTFYNLIWALRSESNLTHPMSNQKPRTKAVHVQECLGTRLWWW